MSARSKALSLTYVRLCLGGILLMHGLANTFGLFGGPGLASFADEIEARMSIGADLAAYIVAFGQLTKNRVSRWTRRTALRGEKLDDNCVSRRSGSCQGKPCGRCDFTDISHERSRSWRSLSPTQGFALSPIKVLRDSVTLVRLWLVFLAYMPRRQLRRIVHNGIHKILAPGNGQAYGRRSDRKF